MKDKTSQILEVTWQEDGDSIQTYTCEVTLTSQE
jgi:hypothetical protein